MHAHQIVFCINIDVTFCAKKAKKCVSHYMDGLNGFVILPQKRKGVDPLKIHEIAVKVQCFYFIA